MRSVVCSHSFLVVGAIVFAITSASAQSMPDGENGRYTLLAVKDGVVRLDTRTGVVSTSPSDVLDGDLEMFMAAARSQRVTGEAVEVEDVD